MCMEGDRNNGSTSSLLLKNNNYFCLFLQGGILSGMPTFLRIQSGLSCGMSKVRKYILEPGSTDDAIKILLLLFSGLVNIFSSLLSI